MSGKHGKPLSARELSFEFRLNCIIEELEDIQFDAADMGINVIAHKVDEGIGPLRNALGEARYLSEAYGGHRKGVWP